jgi:hypothetical protein
MRLAAVRGLSGCHLPSGPVSVWKWRCVLDTRNGGDRFHDRGRVGGQALNAIERGHHGLVDNAKLDAFGRHHMRLRLSRVKTRFGALVLMAPPPAWSGTSPPSSIATRPLATSFSQAMALL